MMKCFVFSLLLGSLCSLVRCLFPAGSCDNYINKTDPCRNYLFTSTSFSSFPLDIDHTLSGQWVRFLGVGGDRVITTCHGTNRGGVQTTVYLTFSLPTTESATETSGTAYVDLGGCSNRAITISVVLCPGGFYIYKPPANPYTHMGYITYHHQCNESSCGSLAECSGNGGCVCVSGYEIPSAVLPQGDSYGCEDIDECVKTQGICGSDSDCRNSPGSYVCACHVGYEATDTALPISKSNPCKDADECLQNPCGEGGTCTENIGSFTCACSEVFLLDTQAVPLCQDMDECFNSTVCGPDSECTNTPGSSTCACKVGYKPTTPELDPSEENICIDIGECGRHATICGPYANCTNATVSLVSV